MLGAAFCVLAGCAGEDERMPEELAGEEQLLHITVGGDFAVKSALVNTGASQHIEHMYLYIFGGKEDGFECFWAEELDWTPVEGTGLGDFTHRLKNTGLTDYGNSEVTFLVVAVDNNDDTYNFPEASATDHLNVKGRSLGEVKAVFAGSDASRMSFTELFSGAAVVPASTQIIEVSLERCVAGVFCYLSDIPYLVVDGDNDSKITSIELRINNGLKLNSTVNIPVTPDVPATGSESVDGTEGAVLASVDLSGYNDRQGDGGQESSLLYIPVRNDGTVVTLENTVLMGAYMVPLSGLTDNTRDNSTLEIVLKGGTKTVSYPVKYSKDDSYNYPLEANHLYAIGSKPFSGDTEGDRPSSLSGNPLLLDVIPWNESSPNVEFPVYSLQASFRTDMDEDTILSCIGDIIEVEVLPAEGGKQWHLNIEPEGESAAPPDWIWFSVQNEDGSYSAWQQTTYDHPAGETQPVKVRIWLADHAEFNDIMGTDMTREDKLKALRDDYRTTRLLLTTDGVSSSDVLDIRQYNAITVQVYDDEEKGYPSGLGKDAYRAFAREDLKITGTDEVDEDGYSYSKWGVSETGWDVPITIFGHVDDSNSDGELNDKYAYAYNVNNGFLGDEDNYYGSVLWKGRRQWEGIKTDMRPDATPGKYWYTPASDELRGFFERIVLPCYNENGVSADGVIPDCNIHLAKNYWSSTTEELRSWIDIYAGTISSSGVISVTGIDRVDNSGYVRQARKFE